MKKSRRMLAVAIGATLLAIGLPVWAAEDARADSESDAVETQAATPAVKTPLPLDGCEWDNDPGVEEVGLILPGGRQCLSGGPPNTCEDYPVAVGGSCSCSSSIIQERCRECETGKKGQVLETSCEICPPCYSPPCQIQQCITRTSRTCAN